MSNADVVAVLIPLKGRLIPGQQLLPEERAEGPEIRPKPQREYCATPPVILKVVGLLQGGPITIPLEWIDQGVAILRDGTSRSRSTRVRLHCPLGIA